jgi:hypothetical protein
MKTLFLIIIIIIIIVHMDKLETNLMKTNNNISELSAKHNALVDVVHILYENPKK